MSALPTRVDLIRVGPVGVSAPLEWVHGDHCAVRGTPRAVSSAVAAAVHRDPSPEAVLLLDADFDPPADDLVAELLDGPADVWHGGVALGLGDQPRLWDRVDPLSMFSAEVDPTIEVTSWRLSLRALLVRTDVLRQLGGPDPCFDTLSGAGLDLGLRWIRAGALVRHHPALVPPAAEPDPPPTVADQLRVVARHRGRRWAGWALARAVGHEVPWSGASTSLRTLRRADLLSLEHYDTVPSRRSGGDPTRTVSVVVPTVDRYSYLEPLLHQLADQTLAPHEVIVVDQTPLDRRRSDLAEVEPTLPVHVIEIPEPGQCSARNAALDVATGELVLFIDDDDEIPDDLIASHLDRLVDGIDASSGGVDDATAGPPPAGFRHRRAADVFPTNNTMLRRSALRGSGLFDLAYDRGARADHDLGMRLHLSGAVLVYDPTVEVFHHHAPMGGLRTHGARKVTRAGSRRSILQRSLPSVTELYLGRRYFRPEQRSNARWISLVSQLSGEGPRARRVVRAVVQAAMLPVSVRELRRRDRAAAEAVAHRPPIPTLPEPTLPEGSDR